MNHLFWGLFFCLLDMKWTVGTAVFELLPDFFGYFLLMKGMTALAEESPHFDRGRHWAFGLCVVSAILYGANLMDPAAMTRVWLWALELAEQIAMLALLRSITAGMRRMEQDGQRLDIERLKFMWLILAALLPVCHLAGWIPLVGPVCAVASAVAGVLFLIAFRGSVKQFRQER